LIVFIDSSATKQTYEHVPCHTHTNVRAATTTELWGSEQRSGLNSKDGNRREPWDRWWGMQVSYQQRLRCHGQGNRCLYRRDCNRHATVRNRNACLHQGVVSRSLAARMTRWHYCLPAVLSHVMAAFLLGRSKRDSGENTGDSRCRHPQQHDAD